MMDVSVVIPTRNRASSLRRLLASLQKQLSLPMEIIIVDASDDTLYLKDIKKDFSDLPIIYFSSIPSVCVQRNIGINMATNEWIFLCDDDLELPSDYLQKISLHIRSHPEAGAVSGIVLQKHKGYWIGEYPVTSAYDLLFRYIFKLSIWGSIDIQKNKSLIAFVINYYNRKGNHIAKSGWPVITDFSNNYFKTPVFGLGASVIRKTWLINSPFDEVLDPHGIGDNYGVALGFPPEGIHITNNVSVHHHEANENRLDSPILYCRRVLALNYFMETRAEIKQIKKHWFLWSLFGSMIRYLLLGKAKMANVNFKLMQKMILNKNPYVLAKKSGLKIVSPAVV